MDHDIKGSLSADRRFFEVSRESLYSPTWPHTLKKQENNFKDVQRPGGLVCTSEMVEVTT